MINSLIYKLKTRGYFNPDDKDIVNSNDLLQILKKEIINPYKLKNFSDKNDYLYTVISGTSSLELCDDERNFEINEINDIFYRSKWFGRFSCEGRSRIIIPDKYIIEIHKNKDVLTHTIQNCDFANFSSLNQNKKYDEKVLISKIGLDEMLNMVNGIR